MYMTAHYAVSVHLKSFMFLAISNTIQKNIAVLYSNKYIQPLYHGECNEIGRLLIADLEFTTHKMF
jgi:hypothetical protein